MKRTKQYSLFALILLVSMLFSACAVPAAPAAPADDEAATGDEAALPYEGVKLVVNMEGGHATTTALQELLPEFEEATGMDVVFEIVPYENTVEMLMLNFTSNSGAIDVVQADWTFMANTFGEAGYLEPISTFQNDPNIDNSDLNLDDFIPAFLNGAILDDELYGLPSYGESTFMLYRTDLFEEAGLEPPATLDDMAAAAAALTQDTDGDGEIDTYGITMRGRSGIHVVYIWAGFLQAFGGTWFDDDMKPIVNSPEAVAATEYFTKILQESGPPGAANFGWIENRVFFNEGNAAMTIDATVNAAFAEDPEQSSITDSVGYAIFPKEVAHGSSYGVHYMYVTEMSNNKEAAWEFAKWATSEDVQRRSLEIAPHNAVTRSSVFESDLYNDSFGHYKDVMVESLNNGNPDYVPRLPETFELITEVGIAIAEVLTGEKDAQTALDEANVRVEELMERSGYYDE